MYFRAALTYHTVIVMTSLTYTLHLLIALELANAAHALRQRLTKKEPTHER